MRKVFLASFAGKVFTGSCVVVAWEEHEARDMVLSRMRDAGLGAEADTLELTEVTLGEMGVYNFHDGDL